jgi:hypothetical protein
MHRRPHQADALAFGWTLDLMVERLNRGFKHCLASGEQRYGEPGRSVELSESGARPSAPCEFALKIPKGFCCRHYRHASLP